MAMDSRRHIDKSRVCPLGDRLLPGQIEKVRIARSYLKMWGPHPAM